MSLSATALYTIGHSNHAWEAFLPLLQRHEITLVCDARSQPYSRRYPQYRREVLEKNLAQAHIQYRFMGDALGARTTDASCYQDNKVVYSRLAATMTFQKGLTLLTACAEKENTAILCAERDPITCHRMILVTRQLRSRGLPSITSLRMAHWNPMQWRKSACCGSMARVMIYSRRQPRASTRLMTGNHSGSPTNASRKSKPS